MHVHFVVDDFDEYYFSDADFSQEDRSLIASMLEEIADEMEVFIRWLRMIKQDMAELWHVPINRDTVRVIDISLSQLTPETGT